MTFDTENVPVGALNDDELRAEYQRIDAVVSDLEFRIQGCGLPSYYLNSKYASAINHRARVSDEIAKRMHGSGEVQ